MFTQIVLFATGLLVLIAGGELLVRGSVALAQRLGMSSFLIGVVLVGFGTSSPELVTTVQASLQGVPGVAIGNFVGSNIANLLLILGLTAVMVPVVGSRPALWQGVVMVAVSAAFVAASFYVPLDHILGGAFLAALALYIFLLWKMDGVETEEPVKRDGSLPLNLGMAIAGLALLVLGGGLVVDAAVAMARSLQVSDTVIGLTIVAVGTSLPELTTSLVAAAKKKSDLALGNVIGSNIYNILGIGGLAGVIAPTTVPADIMWYHGPFMLAVGAITCLLLFSGMRLSRLEGIFLVMLYVFYLAVLVVAT